MASGYLCAYYYIEDGSVMYRVVQAQNDTLKRKGVEEDQDRDQAIGLSRPTE